MRQSILVLCSVLFIALAMAQDSGKKKVPPPARPDTLVSRTGLIESLRAQQQQIRLQAQDAISQIQGQIDAFASITTDSVWVKRSILGR